MSELFSDEDKISSLRFLPINYSWGMPGTQNKITNARFYIEDTAGISECQ